jgi:uncharacterized SAM-binding protein YcdF (DUF218 family)
MVTDSAVIDLARELWSYLRLDWPLEKTDCIVGLGSYDLRVAERCAELYKQNWAPLIVFSGHLGNWTKGIWDGSEAEIFAEHAIARGIPADKIKLEAKSTNIGENLRFTRKLLLDQGIYPKSVTIVSKPATERRIFATCGRIWPEMKICITSPRITFNDQLQHGIQEYLVHEMVGDIQRIKIYPDLGFQIPQDIPDRVWSAFEKLVVMGYDKHLLRRGE